MGVYSVIRNILASCSLWM